MWDGKGPTTEPMKYLAGGTCPDVIEIHASRRCNIALFTQSTMNNCSMDMLNAMKITLHQALILTCKNADVDLVNA